MWEDIAFGNYIAGQADADSSFVLFVAKDARRRFGVRSDPLWIMTKTYDIEILRQIQKFLGVGRVYERPQPRHRYGHRQSSHQLIVQGSECSVIVDFFEKFPLRANKRKDFHIWKKSVALFCLHSHRCMPWRREEISEMVKSRLELDNLSHRLKRPGRVDVLEISEYLKDLKA